MLKFCVDSVQTVSVIIVNPNGEMNTFKRPQNKLHPICYLDVNLIDGLRKYQHRNHRLPLLYVFSHESTYMRHKRQVLKILISCYSAICTL